MTQRQPRIHNEAHLRFIRSLDCLVCHDNTGTQAAHIRFSDAAHGKVNAGVGAKPDDRYAVPLCGDCHYTQHATGSEQYYWKLVGIDPLLIAEQLYAVSGDHEAGCEIVENAQAGQMLCDLSAG